MTEPGAGSDLQGIRTSAEDRGDHWLLNGSKTFISNGILADLVIVVAKTTPEGGAQGPVAARRRARHGGLRARPQPRQDRPEVPGHGRAVLQRRTRPQGEPARRARRRLHPPDDQPRAGADGHRGRRDRRRRVPAGDHHRSTSRSARPSGGRSPSSSTSASRSPRWPPSAPSPVPSSTAASWTTRTGELDAVHASMAKWWATELQKRVADRCLQLHGGYGYMTEYRVARAFTDGRIQTIYGGTTEIMKEIIGRSPPRLNPAPTRPVLPKGCCLEHRSVCLRRDPHPARPRQGQRRPARHQADRPRRRPHPRNPQPLPRPRPGGRSTTSCSASSARSATRAPTSPGSPPSPPDCPTPSPAYRRTASVPRAWKPSTWPRRRSVRAGRTWSSPAASSRCPGCRWAPTAAPGSPTR